MLLLLSAQHVLLSRQRQTQFRQRSHAIAIVFFAGQLIEWGAFIDSLALSNK
ncbi:hypothetical protein [Amantichitinum ursilacus]|uniref:hypothetical protein n=1 Tax=Amantichitinum ursilacus TaxID=857265 RepID=UPI0013792576|nr:hypothetical protein [Amantichitinum ursilacus]